MQKITLEKLACPCGRDHRCPIEKVVIRRGAAEEIAGIKETRVLLIADENTLAAAGRGIEKALAGKAVARVIFPGKPVLVPDEKAIARAKEAFSDHQILVGVGSGVIQDLCKYLSKELSIPYLVYATAPSMDGYASTGAAMILGGMKVTVPAGLPRAILADPEVLKNAPIDMIRAGYGDIIGKFSALNDWRLAGLVNGEYFCEAIADDTFERVKTVLALAGGIQNRDEASVAALMEALVAVGVNMSHAGSSRPASGSEHHLSHFFEITGILRGEAYLPHGIDVAFSTVLTAALRERILKTPFPTEVLHDREAEKRGLARVYGPLAPACEALQEKAGSYEKDRLPVYLEKEPEIRALLSRCPSADEVRAMLSAVGLEEETFTSLYGEEKIRDALLWAKDLKDRYTVLWTAYDLGCLE